MKAILEFLKSTVIGGLLVLLPLGLFVFLAVKAVEILSTVLEPISTNLPEWIARPQLLALLVLILIAFVIGLAIRPTIGPNFRGILDRTFLTSVPGYSTMRGIATGVTVSKDGLNLQAACIEQDGGYSFAIVVERRDGLCTLFIPSSPAPGAGSVMIWPESKVVFLEAPSHAVLSALTHFGLGSISLVADAAARMRG